MALRTALGKALYRIPGGLRTAVPRPWRDRVRLRVGPFAPWEHGFTHVSPPPGPGEVAGPPTFVGIGVQKAGTTWWFGLLAAHPGVFHRPTNHKERHYFTRYATEPFGAPDVEGYHAWFARPENTIAGEWTPDYLWQPWVRPLLVAAAPEARFLLMVRDPVERFVSGMAHSPIVPSSHSGSLLAEAVSRGFYGAALKRWEAELTAGTLLVLQYEACVADPAGELARTYRFLGLDEDFRPAGLRRLESPTGAAKVNLAADARRRLVDAYSPDVAALASLVPGLDLALWPNFKAH